MVGGVANWTAVLSAIGSLLSALVTIALAVLGYFSWRTSKAAVEIAKDSLYASKELAAKQSRAYVFITKAKMEYSSLYDEASNAVSFTLQNYGQTPAQLTAFGVTVIEGANRQETRADDQLMRAILGPGEIASMLIRFHVANSEQIEAGHEPLRLIASAKYRDMDGVQRHVMEPFMFSGAGNSYGFAPYEDDEHRSQN